MENLFCVSCSYPLTLSAYEKIKQQEVESSIKALERNHEKEIRDLKQELITRINQILDE
jgi:hypothetical protein